jgi:hypothetical protein
LIKEGEALRKNNELAAAVEKYRAAHELLYSPLTAVELGRLYLELRRLVDAREAFLSVARIEVAAKEPQKVTKAREEAAKLADELATRIPSITLKIERVPPGGTLVVTIDDETLPKVVYALPRKLDPGKHRVLARVEGTAHVQTFDVDLAEGESKTLVIALGPPPQPKAPDPVSPPPPSPIQRPASPLVFIGFGAAGVGLVVGGVSAIVALGKVGTLRDECVDNRCPPEVHSDLRSARTASMISTVSFVVAGVGVGVGVYGLLVGRTTTTSSVRPYVGLGSLGVVGEF